MNQIDRFNRISGTCCTARRTIGIWLASRLRETTRLRETPRLFRSTLMFIMISFVQRMRVFMMRLIVMRMLMEMLMVRMMILQYRVMMDVSHFIGKIPESIFQCRKMVNFGLQQIGWFGEICCVFKKEIIWKNVLLPSCSSDKSMHKMKTDAHLVSLRKSEWLVTHFAIESNQTMQKTENSYQNVMRITFGFQVLESSSQSQIGFT